MAIPFGLCNAPTKFMRVMNDVFMPFIDDFAIVYLDNIFIFSCTCKGHVNHVKQVLDVLVREKLYLRMSKCEFGKTYLVYQGYTVGDGELKIHPSKVEFIVNWHKPNNVIDVRIFLGVAQY